jgi:hypothetical protein
MDKMRAKVGKDRPQVVCADRNLNHREIKKRKVTSHQHNVADEILQVIDMVDTHEFVQEIVHTKQRVPLLGISVTLKGYLFS